jgi:hypothetical protein
MLIGLLFLLNILAVGGAFFLRWRGWRTAHIWMILVSFSLVEWLMLILIRVENIAPLGLNDWFRIGEISLGLQFQVTYRNWPIAFSILTAMPVLLITGIARLNVRKDLISWSSGIIFIAISFLTVIASDLWAVVILWTVFDLIEIFYYMVIVPTSDQSGLQRSLVIRFIGSLLLIYNTALLSRSGINPLVANITGEQSALFVLAAVLHSGVLPLINQSGDLDQASQTEKIIHRLIKILLLTISISILSFFSSPNLQFPVDLSLSVLLIFLLIQFGIQLNSGKIEEFNEKWQVFITLFIVFLFYNFGNIVFWITVFYISSIFLILYTHRNKSSIIFPLILLVLISGLPYTLNTFGVRGFVNIDFLIPIVLSVIFLSLFLGRFYRTIKQEREEIEAMEPLYQIVYLSGLLVIVLSAGLITFKFIGPPQEELSLWWLGLVGLLLTGLFIFLSTKKNIKIFSRLKLDRSTVTIKILSLDWLFNLGDAIAKRMKNLAAGFSDLLEGAGGLLWALVLLVLILSILQ